MKSSESQNGATGTLVLTRPDDWSLLEYGGALTEMVLLGVLAIRLKDQRLEWDSRNLRFTNNAEANELLKIPYREGWTL
jgi:hypothetical protein